MEKANREIICNQIDTQIKELTTYNGLSETDLIFVAKNISQSVNGCGDLVATPDFLLLLDAVNGLACTGERPSKEFQKKYVGIVKEMLNNLVKEKELT